MTKVERLARFATRATFDDVPDSARDRLKVHLLDTLGCAIGAIGQGPVRYVREQIEEFGGIGPCTAIGIGPTAPDRATQYNNALTRYLDFMDNFLAEKETCHPSDNFAAVLACAEYAGASGRDFLTALAVAYQVQCRLAETSPVMLTGLDHTTHLALSAAAGASRALGLDEKAAANGIAMAGTSLVSSVIVRASPNTQYKGIAAAFTSSAAVEAAFLAKRGMTGPVGLIEGPKGWARELQAKMDVEWEQEKLDVLPRCLLKAHNAEVHTQSTLEATLDLRDGLDPADIVEVVVDVFKTAYDIVGNGEYGSRHVADTKEQADHSLPYLVAVALLDGEVWPEQLTPERIARDDVQSLMKRVTVQTPSPVDQRQLIEQKDPFTDLYPEWVPARVKLVLRDGREVQTDRKDYDGFRTRPFTWDRAMDKYRRLTCHVTGGLPEEIADAVSRSDTLPVRELTGLLSNVGRAGV